MIEKAAVLFLRCSDDRTLLCCVCDLSKVSSCGNSVAGSSTWLRVSSASAVFLHVFVLYFGQFALSARGQHSHDQVKHRTIELCFL